MYSKVAQIFAVASMVTFVAALPSPQGSDGAYISCGNGGFQQCCNEIQDSQSGPMQNMLSNLLGVSAAAAIAGQVGVDCSPILAVSSSCTMQTACCTGNSFGGGMLSLVNLNCDNINI